MGAGLALQFKKRFPLNYAAYRNECQRISGLRTGEVFGHREKGIHVINFPTKKHWRDCSDISYIQEGMRSLIKYLYVHDIRSIAIPPLGCGLGGLKWDNQVGPVVIQGMNILPYVTTYIMANKPEGL
jgi:O-acetyl-ADP-ribose deacetylase (regulator of RNase III)